MKIPFTSKLSKQIVLLSLAIFALGQPLFATPIADHNIVLTENSSTDLTVTFDGSPVTVENTAPDRWTVTFSDTFIAGAFTAHWEENPASNLGNIVNTSATNQMFVFSDLETGGTNMPNGSTVSERATDNGNSVSVNITFHDIGDGAKVPDTGSTLGLLLLPVVALLVGRRRLARAA